MYEKLKFLVVDDHAAARHLLALLLRSLGAWRVETVGNGSEALKHMKIHGADIVLCDWNMPVMSGLELLREIRADALLATTPVVMIMMESSRDKVQEVIDAGVTNLIVKPLTAARLDAKVASAAKGRFPEAPAALFTAPLPALSAAAPAALEGREAARSTILAVDDTPDNLKLISGIFEDEYKIKVAHNGEKALSICFSETPPDLVLLDVMMPGMDGFEVARRMREHPNSEHIPIIFVTAVADDRARATGLALGAVDYVTKPIDPQGLLVRVRNFMRYVERHKQLQGEYDAMLEASRLKEGVEHITSYDTRGPLAAAVALIRQMAAEPSLNEAQLSQLDLVEEGILQSLDSINASTELYKIVSERYPLRPEAVDLASILARTVARARITHADRHLTLSLAESGAAVGAAAPLVLGDAMLALSLVRELLKEVCTAAPDASQITVALYDETPVRLSIEWQGTLSESARAALFEPAASPRALHEPEVNLYLAKMFCEAQGGALTVDSGAHANRLALAVTLPRA